MSESDTRQDRPPVATPTWSASFSRDGIFVTCNGRPRTVEEFFEVLRRAAATEGK